MGGNFTRTTRDQDELTGGLWAALLVAPAAAGARHRVRVDLRFTDDNLFIFCTFFFPHSAIC